MKQSIAFFSLIFLLFSSCSQQPLPQIEIATSMGRIIVEVDTVRAPETSGNFIQLVRQSAYSKACFYRVVHSANQSSNSVKIDVIQGGLKTDSLILQFPAIQHETTQETGINHLDGTISMARREPGSASTEFFICIGAQPELDFGGKRNPDGQGFAAFGRVIEGMDIVRQIQQKPDQAQMLIDPVVFTTRIISN